MATKEEIQGAVESGDLTQYKTFLGGNYDRESLIKIGNCLIRNAKENQEESLITSNALQAIEAYVLGRNFEGVQNVAIFLKNYHREKLIERNKEIAARYRDSWCWDLKHSKHNVLEAHLQSVTRELKDAECLEDALDAMDKVIYYGEEQNLTHLQHEIREKYEQEGCAGVKECVKKVTYGTVKLEPSDFVKLIFNSW